MMGKKQLECLLNSKIKIDIILPLLEQIAQDINTINWVICINKMENDLKELKMSILKELNKEEQK